VSRVPKLRKYDVTQGEIDNMLRASSSLLIDGHYVIGDKHRRKWFNPFGLTANPIIADRLAQAMKERWLFDRPQVIVAAAPRAMIIGHHLALHFSLKGPVVEFVYLEKGPMGYAFRPHHAERIHGKIVLICDDAIRSGKTAQEMIDPVAQVGGHVLGVTTVIDCGRVTALDLGVSKIVSLHRLEDEEYDPPCPMCEQGIKINTVFGDGQKFLDDQRELISSRPE